MSLRWDPKDPDEILDYDVDWTDALYSADERALVLAGATVVPADTISTSTFILPTGTLVANSTSNTTTETKVWLSGGADGLSYNILNRVITVGGRSFDRTIKLKVKTK